MLIKRKSIEAQANLKSGPTVSRTSRVSRASSANSQSKPPRSAAPRKIKFAPVTLSEHDGVRYLHFGTEWVQGAMRLRKPNWPELEYAQQMMAWMLFIDAPQHVAQLGLGTGALTKFCYKHFPDCRVTAVELNPSVIAVCESMFKLPANDARLNVLEMNADDYVNDVRHHDSLDALQVDLYDATARGPVLDSAEFYQACAACLHDDGVLTVNLFGDHPSFERNKKALKFAFKTVFFLPQVHDGNVVAIASKRKITLDFDQLQERAAQIRTETKLPAKSWVDGLAQIA